MMRKAFTLIELLVVIGIIAALIAILLPVLGSVRKVGARTSCSAQLHDVASLFQMYLNDSGGKLPRVNTVPSIDPPLTPELALAPGIAELLEPYHKGTIETGSKPDDPIYTSAVFRCPSDIIINDDPKSPDGYTTWFEREGTSYDYSSILSRDWHGQPLTNVRSPWRNEPLAASDIIILQDFESFHGDQKENWRKNYLFADWSVRNLED